MHSDAANTSGHSRELSQLVGVGSATPDREAGVQVKAGSGNPSASHQRARLQRTFVVLDVIDDSFDYFDWDGAAYEFPFVDTLLLLDLRPQWVAEGTTRWN